MTNRPRVLIEDWLPVTELGIESRRERAAASALPPLSFLHVWWARRPLVASAGVVLAGLLPAWSKDLAAAFPDAGQLADERAYHAWLLRLIGIWGDPISARAKIDRANAEGYKLSGNGYGYKQAFRNSPSREEIELLHGVLRRTWGELPLVADPTAGGGSIPFSAARLGLPTHANDLNGVAAAVLRAGVKVPAEHGADLLPLVKSWGRTLVDRVRDRLRPFFPLSDRETIVSYIWAHTVACPRTGRLVPLLTDRWLRRDKGKEVAVRVETTVDGVELTEPCFTIVRGEDIDFDPAKGIVSRGSAISPYDHLAIDGDYIKSEAQAGRLGQVLYAVAIRHHDGGGRGFRSPTDLDLQALEAADKELARLRPEWEAGGTLPIERFARGNDNRPVDYGMFHWADMFSPRQLLGHGTFVEEFRRLVPEVRTALGQDLGDAVLGELAMMQGTALNYNSRLSSWHLARQAMRSVFDRHDFAFKWTFAEFEGAALWDWVLYQLLDSTEKITGLLEGTGHDPSDKDVRLSRQVTVTQSNAADLRELADGTVAHLCVDPPYYDNVMYAELADFFYVWEKRTLGQVVPEYFTAELCDKDNEAVANQARFAAMGRRKRELADADYEAKMTAIFAECRRALRDDGVMTVMFTHKRAEAWDTLGMGLLRAGFTIETSWPINTESEHSSHQSGKNAAASTIMLVCRKRTGDGTGRDVYFEDIEEEVRRETRAALDRFQHAGLSGVDLLLSTYGPALSVISQSWPVHSSQADDEGRAQLLRPEEALSAARAEVVRMRRDRLIGKPANLDSLTDFSLIAWDTFHAREFPFDEARRLALAVGGLDLPELENAAIVEAKKGMVRLQRPNERVRRGGDQERPGVRVDAESFGTVIDAVHTVLYVADLDGLAAARTFMDGHGLTSDPDFLNCVRGLVNAIPRTKARDGWLYHEAELLDRLCVAYLPDVPLPADPVEKEVWTQATVAGPPESG